MIVVTVYEWILEVVLNALMLTYLKLVFGHSHILDRIIVIVFNFFMVSILPLFHLMGDNYYRTLVLEHGYTRALWKRLVDLKY